MGEQVHTNDERHNERDLLRKLELELTRQLELQRLGPQAWRAAWVQALDRVYKPFEG